MNGRQIGYTETAVNLPAAWTPAADAGREPGTAPRPTGPGAEAGADGVRP